MTWLTGTGLVFSNAFKPVNCVIEDDIHFQVLVTVHYVLYHLYCYAVYINCIISMRWLLRLTGSSNHSRTSQHKKVGEYKLQGSWSTLFETFGNKPVVPVKKFIMVAFTELHIYRKYHFPGNECIALCY